MSNLEDKIVNWIKKYFSFILVFASIYMGIVVRKPGMPFVSGDYTDYLQPWYETLKANAGFKGLELDVYNYYIPYMCILAIATYLEEINLLAYIKIISIVSEFACAALGGLLACRLTREKGRAGIIIAVLWLSPSIMLNGAYWGQCDYIYIAFILGSILLLLKDRPAISFILLGIAFSFKLQTVFVLPAYLLYYLCKRKFSVLNFFMVPICYLIGGIPAIIAGRPAKEVFGIYFGQMNLFGQLSMNVPNIWRIFPNFNYDEFYRWGVCLTVLIFCVIAYFIFLHNYDIDPKIFLMTCACSSGICVMFLPAMHERYTALFVLLSYLYFLIYQPQKIYLAVILDMITCITYFLYLYGRDFLASYPLLAVINIGILVYLIHNTFVEMKKITVKKSGNEG